MKLATTAFLGALMLAGSAAAQALATYSLPAEVRYPEGITRDPATGALYTAGTENGLLVRIDPTSGASTVVAPANRVIAAGSTAFPGALGMKRDDAGANLDGAWPHQRHGGGRRPHGRPDQAV